LPRKLILCRCEDVTSDDVERAIAAGYEDLEEVKRFTGFGTGPCQGKECLRAVALAMVAASATNGDGLRPLQFPQPPQPFTARPPLAPTELKWFAVARGARPTSPSSSTSPSPLPSDSTKRAPAAASSDPERDR
jgi:bacterioferritin-associated ferredoxin